MFAKYLICVFLLLYAAEGKPREIKCPDYCKCDVVETLRRATCQHKKLYSIEIDIPPQAEVLDLSYNQISELGSHIFLEIGLTNLKLLNLSHNKISQIHLNGLEGLSKLRTLDLSYNMLRYFTDQWFVSLNSLQELYLKGNNLKSINEEPRLNLKHLRVLDLGNCAITGLKPGVFQKLPNLQVLDLSENYLVSLDVEVIAPLANLNTLLVKDNIFDCGDVKMVRLKNYTRTMGISYKDPCFKNKKKKTEQFERMMAIGPAVPEKNVWIYDEEEEGMKNIKVVEVCEGNNQSVSFKSGTDGVLMEIIGMSPIISIVIIFAFGLFLGLILGCSVELHPKPREELDDIYLPDGIVASRARSMSIGSRLAGQTSESIALTRQHSIGSRSATLGRQNSTGSNFRPRSKSGGSRKAMREDRNVLLLHDAGMSDSTDRKSVV